MMENYVGKRLDGRYEIREIIGVGGMAVVYKAYDNIDDRIVAVKILKNEFLANEEFRRRFKNESKAIAVLSHPNIVKVYDVSYGDRLQYIVMEYVEGITLKEYIQQQGVINQREAVFFVMQILRALQHAHDKGIVHRDIKPQNILLLENGAIKVTDFGIARFSASETRTMTDSTIGSVHYISPEQARGDLTDDKADIYSVGVMLYEMLTGRLPFESDNTVSVAIMQLQQDPVMPRTINPSIPIGFEQIVIKAMQKNVYDRYQSAAEMLLDLEEFKRNTSIRFDYDYSNNEATKFIPNVTPRIKKVEPTTQEEDNSEEPVVKNRTIPILIGIVVALVVVILTAAVAGYFLGWFGVSANAKVPKLEGLIYSEEVFAKDYKDYRFEVTEEINPDVLPGTILSQDPAPDSKFNPKNDIIKIVVATSGETVVIPNNLLGKELSQVSDTLIQMGLTVTEKPVTSEKYKDFEPGVVVDIDPDPNVHPRVALKTTVTLFYVPYDDSVETKLVPDTEGLSEADARRIIVDAGFAVSVVYEYNSNVAKDIVITNSYANRMLKKGGIVTITVSRGELIEQTTQLHITLPNTGDYGTITATIDGVSYMSETVLLDGCDYEFTVTGSEPASVFKAFVDSQIVYKCNINFTTTPCNIYNSTIYNYEENTTSTSTTGQQMLELTNMVGMDITSARELLDSEGFTNVTVIGNGSTVVTQFPLAGSYLSDVSITLKCGE